MPECALELHVGYIIILFSECVMESKLTITEEKREREREKGRVSERMERGEIYWKLPSSSSCLVGILAHSVQWDYSDHNILRLTTSTITGLGLILIILDGSFPQDVHGPI